MKINMKCFVLAGCFLASSLALANEIPIQPNKCPNIKLAQQKKAFYHVVTDPNNQKNYIGAEQLDEYDTNATWLVQAGDWKMSAHDKQDAVNQAQKILEGVEGELVPNYDKDTNQWACAWALPRDGKTTYVLATTPPRLPHNYHPTN